MWIGSNTHVFEGTIKKDSSSTLGVTKKMKTLIPIDQHAAVVRFRTRFDAFRDLFVIQTGLHQGSMTCVSPTSKNCAAVLSCFVIGKETDAREELNHNEISRHFE